MQKIKGINQKLIPFIFCIVKIMRTVVSQLKLIIIKLTILVPFWNDIFGYFNAYISALPPEVSIKFFIKNLYKYILGMAFTCTSSSAMTFVTQLKQSTDVVASLNLASIKYKLNFLNSSTK